MVRKTDNTKKRLLQTPRGLLLLALCLLAVMLLSWFFGSVSLTPSAFFSALFGASENPTDSIILYSVRLPRIFACVLAGVGLAISGVLLQTVTDNALAGPSLIGVNQGAGFFVVLLLTIAPRLQVWTPLVSFLGAFLVTCVILLISHMLGGSKNTFVLAGIALGALFSAFISFFTLMRDDVMSSYHAFSVGSCANVSMRELLFPALMIGTALILSLLFSREINALLLGNLTASSLGVRTETIRLIAILCASASAAAVVSFAGLLGFVGLIVPNFARRLTGNHTAYLLGVSALIGAILVLIADLLGRVLIAPGEIPVGIMMACLGAPFFLGFLLQKRHRRDWL